MGNHVHRCTVHMTYCYNVRNDSLSLTKDVNKRRAGKGEGLRYDNVRNDSLHYYVGNMYVMCTHDLGTSQVNF